MIGMLADDFFAQLDCPPFNGVFIDGNHGAPYPLRDAMNAATNLTEHGAIVMHDTHGEPIREALQWLAANGFAVKEHSDTINGIAVATR